MFLNELDGFVIISNDKEKSLFYSRHLSAFPITRFFRSSSKEKRTTLSLGTLLLRC